jgi:hypothetical protein
MPIALAFIAAAALSTGCLWAVARWSGVAIPILDLLIIAGLCSGLALLPRVGLILAIVIMALLVTRATAADPWPAAVLMVAGSGVIWLLVNVILLGSL